MWHIVTTPRFIGRSFFLFPCTWQQLKHQIYIKTNWSFIHVRLTYSSPWRPNQHFCLPEFFTRDQKFKTCTLLRQYFWAPLSLLYSMSNFFPFFPLSSKILFCPIVKMTAKYRHSRLFTCKLKYIFLIDVHTLKSI